MYDFGGVGLLWAYLFDWQSDRGRQDKDREGGKEKGKMRGGEIFHLLVNSPNCHRTKVGPGQSQEPEKSSGAITGRGPSTWTIS